MAMVTISEEEYRSLKEKAQVDTELIEDIARGIKDVLSGRVKEI